ncbi:MAG: hypothetical protein AB7F86_10265 [Bdellovibrionales bacterium]
MASAGKLPNRKIFHYAQEHNLEFVLASIALFLAATISILIPQFTAGFGLKAGQVLFNLFIIAAVLVLLFLAVANSIRK